MKEKVSIKVTPSAQLIKRTSTNNQHMELNLQICQKLITKFIYQQIPTRVNLQDSINRFENVTVKFSHLGN